ncbi:MAG: cytochrome c oxidase subunit 3 [Sphingomonas sp.]
MTATKLMEPWKTAERQHVAVRFGVWTFLVSEIMFFSALFMFYAYARWANHAGFVVGAREAEFWYGTANTALLLTSSMTMTVAERANREGLVSLARAMLLATILLGLAFLVVKGFEYRADLQHHDFPGPDFKFDVRGAGEFWAFYWTATGVHAIHLSIGLCLIGRLLLIPRDHLASRWTTTEGTSLYWHLVDMVWVTLYPLLYLVGR